MPALPGIRPHADADREMTKAGMCPPLLSSGIDADQLAGG